jgi:hypothetical protein
MSLKEMYHLCCHCRQFKSIPTGILIKAATLKERSTSGSNMKEVGEEKLREQ